MSDQSCEQAELLKSSASETTLLTKRQLADWLHVSPRTVENWVATRRIPFLKLSGRTTRFDLKHVREALLKREVEVAE